MQLDGECRVFELDNPATDSCVAVTRNYSALRHPGTAILTRRRMGSGWTVYVLPLSVRGATQALPAIDTATTLAGPPTNVKSPTLVSVTVNYVAPVTTELHCYAIFYLNSMVSMDDLAHMTLSSV